MRSLLFVPGDSSRKQQKALESGADVLILDLEDSVAPASKQVARLLTHDFLRQKESSRPQLYVRVNDLSTGLTDDDLQAVMPASPDGIMLPKADHADLVSDLSDRLDAIEGRLSLVRGSTRILPIITETPQGVLAAPTHARPNPRVSGLTWGAEDLSAGIGALGSRDADGRYTPLFHYARTMTILAAAASGVSSLDTIYADFGDMAGLARDCAEAVRDGFTAKMAIHPSQVSVINAAFTPSPETVSRARDVVAAFSAAGDAGVISIGGKMYDRPHLRLAHRILSRSKEPRLRTH